MGLMPPFTVGFVNWTLDLCVNSCAFQRRQPNFKSSFSTVLVLMPPFTVEFSYLDARLSKEIELGNTKKSNQKGMMDGKKSLPEEIRTRDASDHVLDMILNRSARWASCVLHRI